MIKTKKFQSVGIVGFGSYLPYFRLKAKTIAKNWGLSLESNQGLGVEQKAVADFDEDCLTMAVEASKLAIKRAQIKPSQIGAVFCGSESHPYAVKPTGTILGNILGIGNDYYCADLQFACKAGTAGLQIVGAMIEADMIDYGLVVGTDKSQARPGDALEYTAAAGAASFVLGRKKEEIAADLIMTSSFSSDTPDFWRRQGCEFPEHTGRFSGEPGYFYHLKKCLKNFFKKSKKRPLDFDHVVLHMPNNKFPLKLAEEFGFDFACFKTGLIVAQLGNCYSASSLLGLIAVLEQTKAGADILLASYGSGAGSDAFWLKSKRPLLEKRASGKKIKDYFSYGEEIDYCQYLRNYQVLPV